MLVREGDRSCLEARAKAAPGEDVPTRDYYTLRPQIRLTGDTPDNPMQPEKPVTVTLDGNDVVKLVECAIRHPHPNMRNAVLATIWNHPDSFRQIFRFGLAAPPAFPEIRNIVAEELDNAAPAPEAAASDRDKPAEALLPRMPLPPHLRDRGKQRS